MVYGRTVCSLSVKYPWLIWLAGWYMQGGSAGSQYIKSGAEELYVNIGETNWWDARAACKENDEELMSSDDLPEQLVTRLDSSTSYWIGAVKYFSWTWLADKTPFYTYAGYSDLPTVQPLGIPVRSVYSCHYHCTKRHSVFGLSKNRCYCLENEDLQRIRSGRSDEVQCMGNFDEKCGSAYGMSVYLSGRESFSPKVTGYCASVSLSTNEVISLNPSLCTEWKQFACYSSGKNNDYSCEEDVCVSTEKIPWTTAKESCTLLKLTNSTNDNLKVLIGSDDYWIGLRAMSSSKWVNGNDAHGYEDIVPSENVVDPKCLTVYTSLISPRLRLEWANCNGRHRHICNIARSMTTQMATGRTTSKSQSTHYSITKHMRTTSQTWTSSRKTMSEKSDTSESNYGVFMAVGIGSTVLLTAVVVLCLLRRKGRCFKRKDNMQQIRINGTAQVHGMGHETAEYSVIGGITNTCGMKSTDCPSIDPSTCITQNTRPDNSTTDPGKTGECDYNILQARTQHAVPETRGNPYSHLTGPDRFTCKGDYDTAEHIKASRTTGLDITVAHTGPAVRRQTCDEEGQYNVLRHYTSQGRDGADAGVYDHVGSGEGDYDTTHPITNPREDDAYSHIVKVNN